MKSRILLFILFLCYGSNVFSRTGWGEFQVLYKDKNIQVEVAFFYSENSCEDEGKPFKYKYRLNGYVTSNLQYLNWKMGYVNCNGENYYENVSLAIGGSEALENFGTDNLIDRVFYDQLNSKFTCTSLVEPFYGMVIAPVKHSGTGIRVDYTSQPAIDIEGEKNIELGKSTTLAVRGGRLGTNAVWVWYRNACGTDSIGEGNTISVSPDTTTTYFVRAVNKNSQTTCVQTDVIVKDPSIIFKPGWGNFQTLYKDQDISVELSLFHSENYCNNGQDTFKYKYRLNGYIIAYIQYLNWKMGYFGCNGEPAYKNMSLAIAGDSAMQKYGTEKLTDLVVYGQIDSGFKYRYLMKPYFDMMVDTIEQTGTGLMKEYVSEPPSEIAGKTKINLGQSTKLEIKGGKLGMGAKWVWYKNECGTERIGKGNTITVKPDSNTTYFVRAEYKNNYSPCTEVFVNVESRSIAPDKITGITRICKGSNTTLTVEGGNLGQKASWVWYTNNCTGTSIGTGTSITVMPDQTTTYCVRGEGKLNNTDPVKVTIAVQEFSLEPESITTPDSMVICEGQKISLIVNGGSLARGAEWKWYNGNCGGTSIASGEKAEFTPLSNTTYFVRAEGFCNNTNCRSTNITVNSRSISPDYISKPREVYKNKKTTLSVSGGALGKDANWLWYKGSCGTGKPISMGPTLTIKTNQPAEYFVKASGLCNETNCSSVRITPLKSHYWGTRYAGKYNKFLQLGFGLGLEWSQFYANALNLKSPATDSLDIFPNGFGLKGEISFHPFIKNNLSLGFILGGSKTIKKKETTTTNIVEKYSYSRLYLETELAMGAKPFKLLFKLRKGFQSNDYQKQGFFNGANYVFNSRINKETLSLGVRLGRYKNKTKNKRGKTVDLLYTLSKNPDNLYSISSNNYKGIGSWNSGVAFTWWVQSAFKFQFEMITSSSHNSLDYYTLDFKKSTYQVSLIYNLNFFY